MVHLTDPWPSKRWNRNHCLDIVDTKSDKNPQPTRRLKRPNWPNREPGKSSHDQLIARPVHSAQLTALSLGYLYDYFSHVSFVWQLSYDMNMNMIWPLLPRLLSTGVYSGGSDGHGVLPEMPEEPSNRLRILPRTYQRATHVDRLLNSIDIKTSFKAKFTCVKWMISRSDLGNGLESHLFHFTTILTADSMH